MSDEILPKINSSGLFKLKEPFQYLLRNQTWYTCIAIKKIEEQVLRGIDVYDEVYLPVGLGKDSYEEDFKNGVSIITVKSSMGDLVYFPSNYLLSFPDGGGYQYSVMGLGIKLGALPISQDLSSLCDDVEEFIRNRIGVESKCEQIQLSEIQLVSKENHDRFEKARNTNITNSQTKLSQIESVKAENEKLKTELDGLKTFILAYKDRLGDAIEER